MKATDPMPEPFLVRDVIRIGVPTCKETDALDKVASLMLDQAATALIVLDEEADTRGWINEARLAQAYVRVTQTLEVSETSRVFSLSAADIMDEDVPECPSDIPLTAAAQIMADMGVEHLFFLHHAGGQAWPASVLSLRDLVRALAGPEYLQEQGVAAPRPTPMELFRQRYGLPKQKG